MNKVDVFQLVRRGDNEKLLSLMDTIDVNELNDFQNLLHEAVAYGNELAAKELIKRNINVNHQDSKGQSPLHYAATRNQERIAVAILENGGDLAVTDVYGNQPLWTAVFNARGKYEMVELFIKAGAVVDHVNNAGRSPFSFAVQIQDQPLIELLENGGKRT